MLAPWKQNKTKRCLLLGRKAMTNLDNVLKIRDIILLKKVYIVRAMGFPVVMYRCESWTIKMAECWTDTFWTVVLEKTLASLLDCKEIKSVNCKWNQSWIFVGRTDAEVEAPTFWPPDWKSWLIIKYPDAEKIEGSRRRGQWRMRYCMASLTHWTWVWASSGRWWRTVKPACCSPWGHKESDTTEWLNWTELMGLTDKSYYP